MEKKVYQAISAITAAMSKEGISKSRQNSTPGQNYKFRGIDDVLNALSGLLAEHKLCIFPRVVHREQVERLSSNNKALFYTTVEVEFDVVSAEDGSMHTARMCGEAMDSSDKSTNKAMSAAYKYMALQLFCIPTEGDNDTENHTHEVQSQKSKPMDESLVLDHLAAIEAADTEDTLFKVFSTAYKAAGTLKDTAAIKRFTTAKDTRKKQLTEKEPA